MKGRSPLVDNGATEAEYEGHLGVDAKKSMPREFVSCSELGQT